MAAKSSKNTIVAIQANGSGVWGTAETVGANDGIFPSSIDEIMLQGNPIADESIGMTSIQYMDLLQHEVNPTVTLPVRWNGMLWAFLANWMGDDTKTGASAPFTHTFNYQEEPSLVHVTMAAEVNNADIIEWPSLKAQQVSLEPDGDGFLQMTVNCLGDTIKYQADATNNAAAFNAVTYITKTQRMRYNALSLKMNAQGSDPSGQTAKSVTDAVLTLSRPYEGDRTLSAVATGKEKHIDEPVQNGHPEMTFGFNEPDFVDIADFDDLEDETEKTIDFEMAETVSAVAHSLLIEMGAVHTISASAAMERGQRIPLTRNFRLVKPQSAATGQATSNPIHIILQNNTNLSFETGA